MGVNTGASWGGNAGLLYKWSRRGHPELFHNVFIFFEHGCCSNTLPAVDFTAVSYRRETKEWIRLQFKWWVIFLEILLHCNILGWCRQCINHLFCWTMQYLLLLDIDIYLYSFVVCFQLLAPESCLPFATSVRTLYPPLFLDPLRSPSWVTCWISHETICPITWPH